MKNFLSGFFLLGFCFVALLSLSACSDSAYAGSVIKPDSVIKVHDGDTFNVNIAGCPDVLCKNMPVRISGIDAPEMRGKCPQEIAGAIAAKNYLAGQVMNAKDIALHDPTRDKYFRLSAHVFVDGVNVGDEMIKQGLARTYSGGQRVGWCGVGGTGAQANSSKNI
jgi:endonuclease YncB( thermonuclease family)